MRKIMYFVTIIILAAACNDDDTPITLIGLEIQVIDEDGNPSEGASVRLFTNFDDWSQEQSEVPYGETDNNGLIFFENLNKSTYWIDIKNGSKTNWADIVEFDYVSNDFSRLTVTISENIYSDISSATGRSWQVKTLIINDEDLTSNFGECYLDDILLFHKDLRYINHQGLTKCSEESPDSTILNFRFDENFETLFLIGSNAETAFTILSHSSTEWSASTYVSGGNLAGTWEYIFQRE